MISQIKQFELEKQQFKFLMAARMRAKGKVETFASSSNRLHRFSSCLSWELLYCSLAGCRDDV